MTKTEKSTMGMDSMVKSSKTRKEQAYVIALGGEAAAGARGSQGCMPRLSVCRVCFAAATLLVDHVVAAYAACFSIRFHTKGMYIGCVGRGLLCDGDVIACAWELAWPCAVS